VPFANQTIMKALLVSNSSWNLLNFRMPLIQVLQEHSIEIQTAAPEDQWTETFKQKCNCTHHSLQHLAPRGNNPVQDLLLFFELYKLYKKSKPDLVFHFTVKPNIYGGLAARISGISYVAHLTGLGKAFLKKGFNSRLMLQLYRLGLKKAKEVIFHNEEDRDYFISNGVVRSIQTFIVPGSGIDIDHYRPHLKIHEKPFVFVYSGRILPEKGILELCEAASGLKLKYPDIKIVMIGSADEKLLERKWLEKFRFYCREGIVNWFGHQEDPREWLNQAHVFVLPSYREGKSKSLLEAMAMCLPVISTDVPGCRDLFREGAQGLLVPPGQVSSLQHAMEQMMLKGTEELRRMGMVNRRVVELKYSSVKVKQMYEEILFQQSEK